MLGSPKLREKKDSELARKLGAPGFRAGLGEIPAPVAQRRFCLRIAFRLCAFECSKFAISYETLSIFFFRCEFLIVVNPERSFFFFQLLPFVFVRPFENESTYACSFLRKAIYSRCDPKNAYEKSLCRKKKMKLYENGISSR